MLLAHIMLSVACRIASPSAMATTACDKIETFTNTAEALDPPCVVPSRASIDKDGGGLG